MNKIFFFYALSFVFLLSPAHGAKATGKTLKKCSQKNLETLWEKSGVLYSIVGQADVQVTKIFMSPNYAKSTIDEVRSQIFEIQKEGATKSAPVIAAIDAILEKHPECDKNNFFTTKK